MVPWESWIRSPAGALHEMWDHEPFVSPLPLVPPLQMSVLICESEMGKYESIKQRRGVKGK